MDTIRQLMAELAAIEANLHNYADPQLAMAGKQRELLEKMVLVMQRHDDTLLRHDETLQDLGARVECLEAVSPGGAQPGAMTYVAGQNVGEDSYDKKTDKLIERIEGVGAAIKATAKEPPAGNAVDPGDKD